MIVTDKAFEYLFIQRGALNAMAGNRAAWRDAYDASLKEQFENIQPHLPELCGAILDVGSGLGGIDVLLARHYAGKHAWPLLALLDGDEDEPKVTRHGETFNDMTVARDFLKANGVDNPVQGIVPAHAHEGPGCRKFGEPFDLVVSFNSWCFHYPPAEYLQFVVGHSYPATTLILDVRKDKPEWNEQLTVFGQHRVIHDSRKFERRVYRA